MREVPRPKPASSGTAQHANGLPTTGRTGALIGRKAELALATRMLERAEAGRGGALVVRGEPGVGKTRLLAEVCRIGSERGLAVARAACLPLATPLPFDPVLELLRSLRRSGESGVELPRRSRSSQEIFGAAVAAIETVASRKPVLLVLDDLHLSDVATRELVHYCVSRLADLPVVWLLAARPAKELDPLLHYLGRDRLIETLDLPVFGNEETIELICAVAGSDSVSPSLAADVHARSGGNAFLCEELLRALTERRLLRISSGVLEASEPIEPIVPRTVSESVAERAGRLSRSARDLLNWAAVLPEPIERGWLEAMGGQVVDVDLEALVGASFLVSVLPALLRFAHSLVRDAVYESMPVAERRRRHGVVADLLGEARAPQQAPQLAAAGRLEEAAGVYLDLADEALLRGGNDDAAALSGLAESLASRAEAADLQREAAMMLVQALLRSGDVTGAKARAAEFLIELRGQGLTAERLLFLSRYAVGLWDDASDLEAAKAALTDAAELIPLADGHVLAEAAFAQAHILDRGGAPARALPFAERAVAVARETGDRLLELRALTSLGLIVGQVRSAEEGMALLRQAVSIASDEDSPKDAALAYLDLSYLAQVSGDEERGEQFAREGLTLPHLPPALEALLRGNVALGPMNRGDLDTALAYLLSAQAVASRAGPKTAARIGVQLCFVHVMRGELEEAEALLYGISPPAGSWEHYRMLEPWGMLLEERGETEAALRCYLEGGAAVDHPVALWCLGGAVRAAVTAGELETAREALTRLEELGSRWPASSWLIEASRGLLAGATGRVAEGGRLLEQAAQACPEAFHSARLQLEAARLRGDRDGITRAIAAYDAMGAHHAGDRTRALARSLGMRPGRRRKQDSLLSEREQQIALLVASGKTNPEIAKDLFLSRKTVERHVSSVLEKLNLRSRVELAKEVAAGRLPGISS